MNVSQLQQQITAARDRGDTRELVRLQAEYRTHPGIVVTHGGGTVGLKKQGYDVEGNRTGPSSRQATRGVSPSSGSVQHTPLISHVLMSTWERNRLVEYASASEDRLETGGFLFGRLGKDAIEVTNVCVADDDRRPFSMMLRGDYAKYLEGQWSSKIVGTWHTHPSGGNLLSPTDLEAFERYLDLDDNTYSANLILTPGRDAGWPWTPPTMTAWILARKGDGRIRCSRGFLREVERAF
jgi:proteasome lid subunit RPN8/RPN11